MPDDIQIDIRVLKPEGWVTSCTIRMAEDTLGAGCSLREVAKLILRGEQECREQSAPAAQDEDSLIAALALGGVRTPLEGQLRHLPSVNELLIRIEEALLDGLLLVVLNGEPWKEWDVPRVLPNPSALWFARTVWLQHHSWT